MIEFRLTIVLKNGRFYALGLGVRSKIDQLLPYILKKRIMLLTNQPPLDRHV